MGAQTGWKNKILILEDGKIGSLNIRLPAGSGGGASTITTGALSGRGNRQGDGNSDSVSLKRNPISIHLENERKIFKCQVLKRIIL